MGEMAQDAFDLIQHLGWKNVHVVGVSMGGMIAQEFAVKFPKLVNSLTLASTNAGRSFPPLKYMPWLLQTLSNIALDLSKLSDKVPLLLYSKNWLKARSGSDSTLTNYEQIKMFHKGRTDDRPPQSTFAAIAQMWGILQHKVSTSQLKNLGIYFSKVSVPSLVIHGTEDVFVHLRSALHLAQSLSARLVIFEGRGHAMNHEEIHLFNQLLLQHFQTSIKLTQHYQDIATRKLESARDLINPHLQKICSYPKKLLVDVIPADRLIDTTTPKDWISSVPHAIQPVVAEAVLKSAKHSSRLELMQYLGPLIISPTMESESKSELEEKLERELEQAIFESKRKGALWRVIKMAGVGVAALTALMATIGSESDSPPSESEMRMHLLCKGFVPRFQQLFIMLFKISILVTLSVFIVANAQTCVSIYGQCGAGQQPVAQDQFALTPMPTTVKSCLASSTSSSVSTLASSTSSTTSAAKSSSATTTSTTSVKSTTTITSSSAKSTTTTATTTTTTTSTTTTTTSSAATNCGAAYAQCGGINFSGSTCCVSGYFCNAQSQYYSQCIPGSASSTSANIPSSVTTKTSTTSTTTITAGTSSTTSTSASTSTYTSVVSAVPVSGGASGSGTTTRYWDCCKPSCAWSSNVSGVSAPVLTCSNNGNVITDSNVINGCGGGGTTGTQGDGYSYMCTKDQPIVIDDTLAYGFAAASISGVATSRMCCSCYEITFTSTAVAGQRFVVQTTNTGGDLGYNQFDLEIPGGGLGVYDGCSKQFDVDASTWGQRYGGVTDVTGCSVLPASLQPGCQWRFGWFKGADNPTMTFKEV
ncbi:hypothetical protein HK096_000605, partial [Nowakowskiella sp. JEL0078]